MNRRRLRKKLFHAIAVLATFVVVWLVAAPAWAMSTGAPVCDPRGAITFAPPPQIQDEERSIDIPPDCFSIEVNPFDTKNAVPGHRAPIFDFSSSQEPAAASAIISLRLFFAERIPVPVASIPPLPSGVRMSLERPPRS